MRYFLYLAFDGDKYHGWQIQPNAISVQERLQECLHTLLRVEVPVVGAGRTDAGVNAEMMVCHFDLPDASAESWLLHRLNRILPADIAVYRLAKVREDAHARFDAVARTYHYIVSLSKNPFVRHYALRLFDRPDFDLMNDAAAHLLQVRDFTSFSKLHTDARTNNCRVSSASWQQIGTDLWRFEITADRFLRNMVRAIVGTLLDVGRGKLDVDGFKQTIEKKNRCAAGESVPAHALSLVDIKYPAEIFIP